VAKGVVIDQEQHPPGFVRRQLQRRKRRELLLGVA
jgi:hypothetical protein